MTATETQINEALLGFTEVVDIRLLADFASSSYQLNLVLENSEGRTIVLTCRDVSNLSIPRFGGGLNQFMCLRAEDVRERQLDRIAFHFAELEHHAIAFDCSSARIEAMDADAGEWPRSRM